MSYRKKIQNVIVPNNGDTWLSIAQQAKKMVRDYRNLYEMSHETKHFCHYGPFPCYLCPMVDALEMLADDVIENETKQKQEWVYVMKKGALFGKYRLMSRRTGK